MKDALEWAAVIAGVILLCLAAITLVALYLAAIGAGVGVFVGASVWVFRALTGNP